MPEAYISYHKELAEAALKVLTETKGLIVHSSEMVNDGWGDEMHNLQAVVETPDGKLEKIKWGDSHERGSFKQKCSGGGWGHFRLQD